ncbi:MAG: DNA repair protein RecN [Chitinophagaceae bacterium]|nr:MAG: DNA repair protein RecN [Chitinophagaceae bacterium]
MLRQLSIQNYAIIDQLRIDFSGQLNVITGETGAGKSILVGALGLILGQRADSSVQVSKDKKSVVEGVFTAEGKAEVKAFLEENELDIENELVLRREIGVNGKSRAFINDTPVNVSQLQQLTSMLVDLHQQFDTMEIGDTGFQRQVMDALAGNTAVLAEYQGIYRNYQLLRKETASLREQKAQLDREADYHQFQFNELDEAAFRENELEDTDAELKLLSNSEGIKAALDKVYHELEESEAPMVQQLKVLANLLSSYSSYHKDLPELARRLASVQIELSDIAGETSGMSDHISYDPGRIETLNERLSLGYKLQKKHNVSSTAELLAIRAGLAEKLETVVNMDDTISRKEKEMQRLQEEATRVAKKLSTARNKQVKPLEDKVNELLTRVGMPNARLKVDINPQELSLTGADEIVFLFDANKSGRFQPVFKVASGGELSRLMLCIKSLVAERIDLPTLIFDEIDTGISGEAAKQVGIIMKDLAGSRQVVCITHQPQIAGKANAHFFVYKEAMKDKVRTSIRKLDTDERITAIARMLSGEKPTAASLENAREMID